MTDEACGGQPCREAIDGAIERLRREFNDKHKENKREIERLEHGQEEIRENLQHLEGRIAPYLDNGQPGLFSKMSMKLDTVLEEVAKLRIANGREEGRSEVYRWLRGAVAPLVVGLCLLIAQHFWK